ncbi:MAG TPA: transposase [Actinomycetales bacterium]|nr:transposase [Actinomycetales bacterium]
MAQRKKHGVYSPEYRRDAARLVIDSDRSYAEVSRELGVLPETLRRWVVIERARDEAAKEEVPLSFNERHELARLRSEVDKLRKDNEFLKKAAAFFARDQTR